MYFFGAIAHSQVVIDSGTVTQTQVNQFKDSYLRGTAHTPAEPCDVSPPGASAPLRRSTEQPVTAARPQQPCISAEVFCRLYLPLMLANFRARATALGLSRNAERALVRDIDDLDRAAKSTPVDMTAVNTGLSNVEAILKSSSPRDKVRPPSEGQETPDRGEHS
ncbi:hypothetical protein [Streptomyces sp. NPDC001536]|uniref:hypothetical protein n=1 Tax=Streptomyces sp. NPDC001536 TaxID=3364583 RepID=UPI0036C56BB5